MPGRMTTLCVTGLTALLTLGLFPSCAAWMVHDTPVRTAEEILADMHSTDAFIEQKMASPRIHAVGLAVIADGAVLLEKNYGAPSDHLFQGASFSKMVSSLGALELVEQGKMSLDGTMDAYLCVPYFTSQQDRDLITLYHVLTHTSGLPNSVDGTDRRLRFDPGTTWLYSGCGFNYLQHCLESLTGQAFNDWMVSEILPSIGMNESNFVEAEPDDYKDEAGAGLMTTPGDIARFLLYVAGPARDIGNDELLAEMRSPQVRVNADIAWGLGVGIQTGAGEDALWHWGNNRGYYHNLAVYFLESGVGVVIMIEGRAGDCLYGELAPRIVGGYYSPYVLSRHETGPVALD